MSFIFPLLGDEQAQPISFTGKWTSQDAELQLMSNGAFLISNREGSLGLELEIRGMWSHRGEGIELRGIQTRLENDIVEDISTDSPFASMKATHQETKVGVRTLNFLNEIFEFSSELTDEMPIWVINDEEDPAEKGLFLRPPIYPLPRIDLEIDLNEEGHFEIIFKKSKAITGVSGLAIWEQGEDEYLWNLKLYSTNLDKLIYGKLPDDDTGKVAEQISPALPGEAILPRKGRVIFFRLDVNYKTLFPPSIGSDPMFFGFKYNENGKFIRLEDISFLDVKQPKL